MSISELIKSGRKSKGYTQKGLTGVTACHSQTISDVERGRRNLPEGYIEPMAAALTIPAEDIRQAIASFTKQGA